MQIIIRDAVKSDANSITRLFGILGYEIDAQLLIDKYENLIDKPEDRMLVAEVGHKTVAVIGLHIIPMLHRDNDLGRITALVVSEEYRGQGIGKKLVAEVTSIARQAGCGRMEVTSGDHRPKAHEFYEKLGYKSDERRFISQL